MCRDPEARESVLSVTGACEGGDPYQSQKGVWTLS